MEREGPGLEAPVRFDRASDPAGPAARPRFSIPLAGGEALDLGARTAVMGVLNLTPDSFYDGGRLVGLKAALDAAERLAAEGADLIDVGGASTRPGAAEVDADEESRRVLPVIEALGRERGPRISIDTTSADVARRALDAGADLVNDVSALDDKAMLPLVVARGPGLVLMHRRGTPKTMQSDTVYADLIGEISDFLAQRIHRALAAGVVGGTILVDPGLGFGKSVAGNLSILRRLPALAALGRPILVGASRKSFIGQVLDLPVDQRLEGSLAVAAIASWQGAHVIRAHDVAATVRVTRTIDALRTA